MRYVEKDFNAPVVIRHEEELTAAGLDKATLLKRKEKEELSGKELYEKQVRSTECIPHWRDLQRHLNEEQGGVCCYCGARLFFPDTQHYSVEHVHPRNKCPELVGEYENLLLSCHSSDKEREDIKTSSLRKKEKRKMYHCDESKGNEELHYSPLDPDCMKHFSYKLDGSVDGDDEKAEKDIKTLNLQCKGLVDRRQKKLQALLFSSTNPAEMIDSESLGIYRRKIEELDGNGNHREFYFVIIAVR